MIRTTRLRHTVTYGLAALMAGFGLTGIAAAQTITNTGPNSTNRITDTMTNNCRLINTNDISASNYNDQTAVTGSANVSGNTTAGLSWAGWSALDPSLAQANGESYTAWRGDVSAWLMQRASGNGWNSSNSNLSASPSSNSWSGWDPMIWQANGQSFANWYSGVQSYLGSNANHWLLSWPSSATGGSSMGGATSGNATNSSSANFSINITNTAPATTSSSGNGCASVAATNTGGGQGGGSGSTSTPSTHSHGVVAGASTVRGSGSGAGSGLGGAVGNSFLGHGQLASTTPGAHVASSRPSTPSVPSSSGSGAGSGGTSTSSSGSIRNTGPSSSNTIRSTVTNSSTTVNSNCVTVTNSSHQTAVTGSANVSGNTSTGGGGSGNATNGSGTGAGVTLSN